ncbi:endonuclease/exonuclease/phosphatase family protein [Dongia sp.]|uniref:endonuclease/exonuclease/phosphatase family protein n=1 Tax=Dongia sp. TaxID=1977262 RepID=UPI003750B392
MPDVFAALLYPIQLLVHVGLIGVFVGSFAPLLAHQFPPLATLESFLLHITLASLPLTLLGLLFRPRWLALLGLLAFAWNIFPLWPYLPFHAPVTAESAGLEAAPKLKVVSANVWYRNDGYAAAIHYLESTNADVIALIEVTPQWLTALQSLYAKYPYRIDCMQSTPPCEMLLMSKHPFGRAFAGRIDGRSPVIAWGEISLAGRSITVAATHLSWPLRAETDRGHLIAGGALQPKLGDAYPLVQSEQAANLAQYLQKLGPDLVLMGDFNSVPWSRTQATLRAATGLENAGPMVPTWPSWQPRWVRLPIDQIMTRGALTRLNFKSSYFIGSDHLPVEAEIAVTPE